MWGAQLVIFAHARMPVGGPGQRDGPDLMRGGLSLSPVGQFGAGGGDEAQDVVGADGGTGRVRQLDAVAGWPSVHWLVTSLPGYAGMSPARPWKWSITMADGADDNGDPAHQAEYEVKPCHDCKVAGLGP